MSTRHWGVARILLTLVALITIFGALIADALGSGAAQHLANPNWPPHAKFHDAQYIVMSMLLGVIALVLLIRRNANDQPALIISAGILSTPWLGMFGALLFPGTSMLDPEFDVPSAYVLDVHPQVLIAGVLLTVLSVAVVLTLRRR